jgi:hypothetical protein
MKRKVAALFIFVGAVLAAVQWWQIAYRLHLFYVDYKGEPYANHIGDGDFTLIYIVNASLLLTAAFSFRIFCAEKPWRNTALIIGSVNLAGWLALFLMHRTGILVGYAEFIGHMKGIN